MRNLRTLTAFLMLSLLTVVFISCERVEPNYAGVKMNDYGKNGKSDFTLEKGKVWVAAPGVELWQVPLWEQRADFGERILHLKTADNNEITSRPVYSFQVIENRAIDVVFENKQLGSGSDFMESLADNILEPKIYDLMKEESRKYTTDELMANGGSLKFENTMQSLVDSAFNSKGLHLTTFSCQLDFSDKVKQKIDSRNEVNTNISVLDQQIAEQKKRNELAALKAEENKILSSGLTDPVIKDKFIDKWDGHTPLYGNTPITVLTK